jgi:hypothetical protein
LIRCSYTASHHRFQAAQGLLGNLQKSHVGVGRLLLKTLQRTNPGERCAWIGDGRDRCSGD